MNEPRRLRPAFPHGYVDKPGGWLTWSQVEQRLEESRHYWLCSARPDGRPHSVPRWGVWLDRCLYYDGSPETRHARNIAGNPKVSLNLESGEQALIVEGVAAAAGRPTPELGGRLALAYAAKYAALGYSPKPDSWDNGGLFVIVPHTIIAWTSFAENPTKFVLTTP